MASLMYTDLNLFVLQDQLASRVMQEPPEPKTLEEALLEMRDIIKDAFIF